MTDKKKGKSDRPNIFSVLWLRLRTHPAILLGLILFIATAAWADHKLYQLLNTQHQQAVATASKTSAATQSNKVNSFLNSQQQQLKATAGDPQLANALQIRDTEQLATLELQLQQANQHIHQLLFLQPGDQRLDLSLSFVARDLALRALSGESVTPEAALIDKEWQLLFVRPIKNSSNDIVGVLLANIAIDGLQQALLAEASSGMTQLRQQTPGFGNQVFVSTGNAAPSQTAFTEKTSLPHWVVSFTANQNLVQRNQPSVDIKTTLLSCLLAELLITVVALWMVLRRYRNEPIPVIEKAKTEQEITETLSETESFLQVIPSAKSKLKQQDNASPTEEVAKAATLPEYPATIFRDYDIRGAADKQINAAFAQQLGGCLGTLALKEGETALALGWDGRLSSEELKEALQAGILTTGCNVISIGRVPTPLLSFSLHHLSETSSGVMVTASHNPAEDNGFKVFIKEHALCGEEITSLREAMIEGDFRAGEGTLEEIDLAEDYNDTIISDIVPAMNLKVVVDAGNGVAGTNAIDILTGIGCEVVPLYCDVDGNFPNHPPDTAVAENLGDLIAAVKAMEADLGIGLDGDGDRVVAVTASGRIVWPDELLMIFARDVVSRHPGADIVYDVKSTRRLNSLISSYGGRPVMCKTGHSHMRNKIIECDSPLGGEFSGHIFFHDRWHGFDDGTYAAARLIEVMTLREQSLEEILSTFETRHSTPEIKVAVADEKKFDIVDALVKENSFKGAQVSTLDGLRADFPKAWGLVRASNTSPALTLRFEAESAESLEKIQSLFKQQLSSIDDSLTF